ncbi:MAG: peptidoglycan DD-metalloendopeptidase family protein [Methylobacter sp.]|nr:peptidoglycan DD-metalloendopeptidase family protein [Methylobacter sp.]
MTPSNSKLIFIAILAVLVNGCAKLPPNYAPVTTNQPDIIKDETKYHQVKKGDTLYAISLIYDLDYRQLAQWNKISPPYTIEIDQKIKLSGPDLENKSSPDNGEQLPTTTKMEETKQKNIAATPTNRISSQKSPPLSLNNKSGLAYRPSYKTDSIKNTTDKSGSSAQKKPIISIDNVDMLKLSFQWPIKGKVLKAFAQADNKGIDIAGKTGQDVSAAESGKVVYSGQGLIGYGNLLIIKHNDLYLSAYANNSLLLVAEGDTVRKGEAIAKAGQAGSSQAKSNQASLHFEIRKNGKPVNPVNFLPDK